MLLADFAAAWSCRDLQQVADLWDEHDQGLTYIAEELGQVLLDRDRISEHLLRTEHRLESSRVDLAEIHIRELAPDLALATFICRWEFQWVTYSRVTGIFRRRGAKWFFVHYMESPFHMEDWGQE